VTEDLVARVQPALVAWQQGDLGPLETLLAPDVELLWWEPGEWDCHGRDQVLALLRQRTRERSTGTDVEVTQLATDTLLVSRRRIVGDGAQAGSSPATLVSFRAGQVVRMQQFRSRADALASGSG
jgi:ketosteroid isomerase-like protein